MNIYQKIAVILLSFFMANLSSAVTLTSGNGGIIPNPIIGTGIPVIALSDYSIFVDGDLFLDYSFFTANQDLIINGPITAGGTLNIFTYDFTPTMPDLSQTAIFLNPDLVMIENGNVLIYSDLPAASFTIEATNNIYIGNYSSIRPVPLPASFFLFLSGLVALFSKLSLTRRL